MRFISFLLFPSACNTYQQQKDAKEHAESQGAGQIRVLHKAGIGFLLQWVERKDGFLVDVGETNPQFFNG